MATEAEKLYVEQKKTFDGVMSVMKYSTIALVVLMILMYFFLVA